MDNLAYNSYVIKRTGVIRQEWYTTGLQQYMRVAFVSLGYIYIQMVWLIFLQKKKKVKRRDIEVTSGV